jgi:hypothetical protein
MLIEPTLTLFIPKASYLFFKTINCRSATSDGAFSGLSAVMPH